MTFRSTLRAASIAALICGAFVARERTASAHGGTVRAFEVIVEPGNTDDVLLRSDLWGFFRTRDGGKTWAWTCAEAYGNDSVTVSHLGFAVAKGGRLLVANGTKGLLYTDDGCTWSSVPDLADLYPVDVKATANAVYAATLVNTNTDAGILGYVYKSTDGGTHFTEKSAPLPNTFAAKTLAFAPSNEREVYVTGRDLETTPAKVLHSSDGGASWDAGVEVPLTDPFMALRVAAIHPTRPELVFFWGDLPEENVGQNSPDQLWLTEDAGKTFRQVFQSTGDLPGFVFSPDGADVYLGGPIVGLLHAKLADVLSSGQTAFHDVFTASTRPTPKDRQVWGLAYGPNGLTGGVDNFTPAGVPAFTYGSWVASDHDFSKLMDICDPDYAACPTTSDTGSRCAQIFSDPNGGYKRDFITASGRCKEAADAGFHVTFPQAPPSQKPKDSGGCAVTEPEGDGSGPASLLAVLGFGVLARRTFKRR